MLLDGCGRRIRYLRVSVTAHCNLQCRYCRPDTSGESNISSGPCLSDGEIVRLCRLLAAEGIERLRITGGEPLLRPGLCDLIGSLAAIRGIQDISLTTNGMLLRDHAWDLAAAGVRRINVSLDSLQESRFAEISGGGSLGAVLDGIAAAEEAGLRPVKLNCVVMRGMNDDEAADFALLTLRHSWHVRFIELMPIGPAAGSWDRLFVPNSEVREKIAILGPLAAADSSVGAARTEWQLAGAKGRLGFISPVSEPFCASCDRLRLMSSGELRPCLCADLSADLGSLIAAGASDSELLEAVRGVLRDKPLCGIAELARPGETLMAAIGG